MVGKNENEEVRIMTTLDKKTVEKIDELAEKFRVSRSKFLSVMITEAVENEKWLYEIINILFVKPYRTMVESWKKKEAKG